MSLKKQIERATAKKDKAAQAIYACVPNTVTPFNDCYRMASQAQRDAYDKLVSKIIDLEIEAVSKGKAWRSVLGSLIWNR